MDGLVFFVVVTAILGFLAYKKVPAFAAKVDALFARFKSKE